MLRIGKLTDYATVILATLAGECGRMQTATALAERTHIAAPTVSKLLKQLQRAGLVTSTRGTHGGYQLARAPENISAAAIRKSLSEISLAQLAGLDARTPALPIERELRQMTRAKASPL